MEANGKCSLPNKEIDLEKRVRILKTRNLTEERENFWQDGEGKCVECLFGKQSGSHSQGIIITNGKNDRFITSIEVIHV